MILVAKVASSTAFIKEISYTIHDTSRLQLHLFIENLVYSLSHFSVRL